MADSEVKLNTEHPKLVQTKNGLALSANGQMIIADFSKMAGRLKHNNLSHELLVKAAKLKNEDGPFTAYDATAGLGEDSILLAASGYHMVMFERDPVIAALLKDAVKRAQGIPELSFAASNMEVIEGDSIKLMPELSKVQGKKPDVIVLDPMFPEREKSSLVKKKFQVIHLLEEPCKDEEELLAAAIASEPKRIVIKRPLKGPYLAERKPSYSITGKTVRYDCIVL